MDSVDNQDLRVQHCLEAPQSKRVRQSRITTDSKKKLKFSAVEETSHNISDSEEEDDPSGQENTLDPGLNVLKTPLFNVRQLFLEKKNRDLQNTVNFCQFLLTFLELEVHLEHWFPNWGARPPWGACTHCWGGASSFYERQFLLITFFLF